MNTLKALTLTLLSILIVSLNITAQNVGINETGAVPHESALLDLSSTNKGFLITRSDTADILSPAFGLMTLALEDSCLYMFNGETSGKKWISIGGVGHDCACTISANCPLPSNLSAEASPNIICEGSALNLTGDATDATSYSWTGPNGFSSTSQNPTISSVTSAASGTYTLTASNICGASTTGTASVTVTASPNAGILSGTQNVCIGLSTTFLSTQNGGSWTSSNTSIATVNSSGTVMGQSAGTATITYTITGTGGCSDATATRTVTVNSLPSVNVSSNQSICNGESITITASGASSYSWNQGLGSGSSKTVSPSSTITYTVTGTDGNGCENTDQAKITVNPLPTVSTGADKTICEGESTTLSASGASTYTWSHGLGSGSSKTVSPSSTTTYTVTGTSNGCTNTDQQTITTESCCGSPFTDTRDSQTYGTVGIGDQCWMSENLNYTPSPAGNSWCYDGTPANCDSYGRLYDWNAAQGICPSGWHLPSDAEWKELEMELGMSQSEADDTGLRSTTGEGHKLMSSTSWDGNNSSGFEGLPVGYRHSNGSFYHLPPNALLSAYFWTSTDGPTNGEAWMRRLFTSGSVDGSKIRRAELDYEFGASIRCVKD